MAGQREATDERGGAMHGLEHRSIDFAVLVYDAMHKEEEQLVSFEEARKSFERDYLVRVLKITGGNVTQAARLAKRNRTEFYKLLQRYQLDPSVFKQPHG